MTQQAAQKSDRSVGIPRIQQEYPALSDLLCLYPWYSARIGGANITNAKNRRNTSSFCTGWMSAAMRTIKQKSEQS